MATHAHDVTCHDSDAITITYEYEETGKEADLSSNIFCESSEVTKQVHFDASALSQGQQTPPRGEPIACSTPIADKTVVSELIDDITDTEILQEQTLKPGEPQPEEGNFYTGIRSALSVSRTDLSSRGLQTASFTGLPSNDVYQKTKLATPKSTNGLELDELTLRPSTSRQTSSNSVQNGMGNADTKPVNRTIPRNIMSEEPQELYEGRKKIAEAEVTGNCRPWSDHVYYKLFMDTEGRNATLMVLKCEITYVDVFTDEEHSLYKSRFIGGKADGVAQLFVFDLMKSRWEEKIPQSQAIELNVDIVMSSSPIHGCSETLLNLLQLEKTYLKHRNFDGQLNVMIRFAHAYGWEIKDDALRERVHTGLRNLFREGVNLEVMSADVILEEMRVDGIFATSDEALKQLVSKRHAWRAQTTKTQLSESHTTTGANDLSVVDYDHGDAGRDVASTSSRKLDTMATDAYCEHIHTGLWNIIQDTKRIQDILQESLDDA